MAKSLLKQLAAEQQAQRAQPSPQPNAAIDDLLGDPAIPARTRKPRKPPKGRDVIDKECDEITAFRWVAAHMGGDTDPARGDAPSRAAWNLFKAARDNLDIAEEVWKKFLTLGAKQDDNAGDRLGQTGRFCEKLLKELLGAVREEAYHL